MLERDLEYFTVYLAWKFSDTLIILKVVALFILAYDVIKFLNPK